MPSQTRWFDAEKTIIIHEVLGKWRITDVMDEMEEAAERLETDKYHPRYFIVDLSHADGIPSGILTHRDRYDAATDPDSVTIVVAAHRAIQLFVNAMQRLGLPGTTIFSDTLEDAQQAIQKRRQQKL